MISSYRLVLRDSIEFFLPGVPVVGPSNSSGTTLVDTELQSAIRTAMAVDCV